MVHTKRDNYKAKWQAALAEGHDSTSIKTLSSTLTNITVTTTSETSKELTKLTHTMIEAASAAKNLLELMDDASTIGEVQFSPCGVSLDEKLADMNLNIIARRLRDVLKLSEARIGMISAAYDDLYESFTILKKNAETIKVGARQLQATSLSSLYVGRAPRSPEVDDYESNRAKGIHRFGLTYDDVDDDWISTNLLKGSKLIEKRAVVESSDDDSDTQGKNYTTESTTALVKPPARLNNRPAPPNRAARVVPTNGHLDLTS